jgi:BlaI family penicillinase repressor
VNIKISDAELEVMRILWREDRPLSFTEIRKELEEKTKWSKSTMQTLVIRLRDKGIIGTQSNYVTLYAPNISEQEYINSEGQSFLDKLFGGSAKNLVAALCRSGHLNEADINELKSYFKAGGEEECL